MSILTEFANQLKGTTSQETPTVLIAADGGNQLKVSLVAVDSIGCSFELMELECPQLQHRSAVELQKLADELASRITYLLEPIRTVEVDAENATIQMRSERPHASEDGKSYYELLARPGSLRLCRYLKQPGAVRERTPAHVTQEVVLRLVSDLVGAVE